MVFSGAAGGSFGALTGMIDEVVDVASLPFDYRSDDGHFELEAGDVLTMDADGSQGLHGQQGTAFPHPLVGDRKIRFGKSNEYVVDFNEEFAWDRGKNNSYFGEFELSSA